ncbi:MAG TPA: cyclic nucleotide-binding domain-containing protein [Lacipirellulaceae bacterium]|nr:cyclic nucleotide-binding domain-containing protein [Lacipirellulaceae bacterium]
MAITSLLHVANILYLASYSMRSVLWLRVLTVVAIVCMLPYYYSVGDTPLLEPIAWNTLFLAINLVQIALLILERRPVFLGDEELHLYRTLFRTLKPLEFARLLEVSEWRQAKPGDVLLEQGRPVEALLLISRGRAVVELDDRYVADVGACQFVGEMGFLTEQHSSARVVAATLTDYLAWPAEKLRASLNSAPALHVKLQAILGADLIAKLRREALSAAHPSGMFAIFRDAGAE